MLFYCWAATKDDWPSEAFATHSVELASGETVTMKLAERDAQLTNQLELREIRKLNDSGHQTAMLTTNFQAAMPTLAASLFARWSQENFFRYMREHFGLDRLIEYGTEPVPDAISVVNPQWRKLDSQIRSQAGKPTDWLLSSAPWPYPRNPPQPRWIDFSSARDN